MLRSATEIETGQNIYIRKGCRRLSFTFHEPSPFLWRRGTFKHWNPETGELIATSLITNDEQWAVFSPEGWFDGSKDFKGAHFVANHRYPISFEQLRDRFYQPFLLERLTGVRNEPLPTALIDNNRSWFRPRSLPT